ncbi:MAG: hypothetical protein Q4G16_01330 [Cruoricaptor ignavus]|nr:hypothetical protein [Cruoricaptor ignavus]
MKASELLLLLLTVISISSCKQIKVQTDEIKIIYNSEKYNGKKYDVSINPKIFVINNSNKNIPFSISDIDSLRIIINNTNYVMSIMSDSLKNKKKLTPNEQLIVYYKTDYHNVSEIFNDTIITNDILKSVIINKKKSVIEKSPNFIVKPRIKAYIKKEYHTPNGTKIEEIGD